MTLAAQARTNKVRPGRRALPRKAFFNPGGGAQRRTDCIRSAEISAFDVTNGTPIAIS